MVVVVPVSLLLECEDCCEALKVLLIHYCSSGSIPAFFHQLDFFPSLLINYAVKGCQCINCMVIVVTLTGSCLPDVFLARFWFW